MISLLNITLPNKKNFKSSIRTIYGIGLVRSKKIMSILGLHNTTRIEYILNFDLIKLGILLEKTFALDFELRNRVTLNINFLKTIKTIRGYKHKLGLPTRGQRTHTNASTSHKLMTKTDKFIEKDQRNKSSKKVVKNDKKNKSKK